jgi:hypothetical protein
VEFQQAIAAFEKHFGQTVNQAGQNVKQFCLNENQIGQLVYHFRKFEEQFG